MTQSPLALPALGGSRPTRWSIAAGVTLAAHVALGLGVRGQAPRAIAPAIVTEIELSAPPRPEAPPAPPAPTARDDEAPSPRLPSQTAESPSRGGAARAGKLLVPANDAPSPGAAEPVDFVTDPNGSSYGGGVVARGGTGTLGSVGTGPARAAQSAGAKPNVRTPPASDVTPPSDLSRAPSFVGSASCSGFYPREADADSGLVTVVVVVAADGAIARLSLAGESPVGQGFGAAARGCMRASRFQAALDKAGRPVKAATTVRVRFTR